LEQKGLSKLTAHNFSVNGTDVLHHASITRQLLTARGPHPRLLIWTPNPFHFSEGRRSNRLEQLGYSDLPWLTKAGAPLELLLDLTTMSVFPPYRERPLMLGRLFEYYGGVLGIRSLPLQARLLGLNHEPEPLSRQYHALPDGQEPFVVLNWADRFRRGAEAYVRDYAALKLSAWHFAAAREMLAQAREAGTRVVILEMPVAPEFQRDLATLAVHLQWRERMRALAAQEGALYLDHSALLHDDHLFGDPGHMPETTAHDYSERLGTQLAADPWVRTALTRPPRLGSR
jgi:hypothetical protein